ncbi:MAG: protein kinase [Microthrixaceae bacterium]
MVAELHPGSRLGAFEVVDEIGRGGAGVVLLAWDPALRRHVAIKLLRPDRVGDDAVVRRFRSEMSTMARLSHGRIVPIYEQGTHTLDGVDLPYFVMEAMGGGSLAEMLKGGRTLSVSQALRVARQAAEGLAAAAAQGIVHRDIKPANLLFDASGNLKIADFGAASVTVDSGAVRSVGDAMGTIRYTSPEQARGEELDGRSDVYSLALVVVEAVTGTLPFSRESDSDSLAARQLGDLVAPVALGPLVATIGLAGRRDRTSRPWADELIEYLETAGVDLDPPAGLPVVGVMPTERLDMMARSRGRRDAPHDTEEEAVTDLRDTASTAGPVDHLAETVPIPTVVPAGLVRDGHTEVLPVPNHPAPDVERSRAPVVVVDGSDGDGDGDGAGSDGARSPRGSGLRVRPGGEVSGEESGDADADGDPLGPPVARPVPARRRGRPVVALALILVTAGVAFGVWWFAVRVPAATVAHVIGQSRQVATARLRAQGFEVSVVRARKDGTRVDEVIGSTPERGPGSRRVRRWP